MRPVPDDIRNYIVTHYNIVTMEAMMRATGMTRRAIYSAAHRYGVSRAYREPANKHIWSPQELKYLTVNFHNTENEDLADHLGISVRSVCRQASKLGLRKSKSFMRRTQLECSRAAQYFGRKTGRFEAMKGVYTSNLQAGRVTRFQEGVNNRERNGAQNEAARIRKAAVSRSETIRKERWRIAHGFPQLTKLRLKIVTK